MALFTSTRNASSRAIPARRVVALATAALILVGCAPTARAEEYAHGTTVVWEASGDLIGHIAVGDSVAIGYLRGGARVEIAAFFLQDGRKLWATPASLGGNAPGYDLNAMVLTLGGVDYTAFIESGSGRPVVVDAESGEAVPGGRLPLRAAMRPYRCDEAICLNAFPDGAGPYRTWRFVPGVSGVDDDADRTPDHSRMLGNRIFATNDRAPEGQEMLGMIGADGEVAWTRPYEEVFGKWASSDFGWHWYDEPEAEATTGDALVVGTGAGLDPDSRDRVRSGARVVIDLVAARHTVALAADGGTRWIRAGAQLCPAFLTAPPRDGVIVLCEAEGEQVTWTNADGTGESDWSRAQWALRGVRIASGEVVWERPVGADAVYGDEAMIVSDEESVIVETERGVLGIDRSTGAAREMDGEVVACLARRDPLVSVFDGRPAEQRTGYAAYPCLAGERAGAGFSLGAARAVGVAAGADRYVIAVENGLLMVTAQ